MHTKYRTLTDNELLNETSFSDCPMVGELRARLARMVDTGTSARLADLFEIESATELETRLQCFEDSARLIKACEKVGFDSYDLENLMKALDKLTDSRRYISERIHALYELAQDGAGILDDNFLVCPDCAAAIDGNSDHFAYHYADDGETEKRYSDIVAQISGRFEKGESLNDLEFSRINCECCSSTLAGARYSYVRFRE